MKATTLTAAIGAPLALLLLTGCGLGSTEDDTADGSAASESASDGSADGGAGGEEMTMEAAMAVSECVREGGLDLGDPITNADGEIDWDWDAVDDWSEDDMTVLQECFDEHAPVGEGADPSEYFATDLEVAECLREAGFEVSDPVQGEMWFPEPPDGADEKEFLTAAEECFEEIDPDGGFQTGGAG